MSKEIDVDLKFLISQIFMSLGPMLMGFSILYESLILMLSGMILFALGAWKTTELYYEISL